MNVALIPYDPASDWPEVDLSILTGPQIEAPAFPVGVLRDWWGDWCQAAAKGASAPVDYTAAGLLTVAGSLIGNARVVAPRPDWHEPPILWTVLLGAPSAGKSPALDPMSRILDDFEAAAAADHGATVRAHTTETEAAKARRDAWLKGVKAAAKSGSEPPLMPHDAEEPPAPARPRVRLSDTTLEAAAELSAWNPNGLLLFRDELAGWWRGFDRYNGGDGERQFWLQAYGARSYVVDRKTAANPVTIERLAISVLGGVQPDVMSQMLSGEADGFAARFLYAYPEPVKGFSLVAPSADREAAKVFLSRLKALVPLAEHAGASSGPLVCPLDTDAAIAFESWWRDRRSEASETTGLWGGWLGKQGGHALRMALILEHLWWCAAGDMDAPQSVGFEAMNAAIGLIDGWAGPMAKRAFGASAISLEEADATTLARWLRRSCLPVFNSREARRSGDGPGGRLSKPAAMNAACKQLEQAGLIRAIGGRASETAGRQRNDYAVSPTLLKAGES
ncbi:hypothetical protein FM111_00960 [Brevundimonas diminuta 3F5N]|uniref:DUF3987 domain-containing protein n=1 Tax=Brevundimonas diminuta 3F5N TaxID=1255603 RepID=A0A1R4EV14_BREDI|nr:DUF3987 domain-containing protein [Brevundimonas diminuta]SJM47498.1 hypothetical protein FM111_00960 [Brevundimonas diminuta 3F5N]